MMLSIKKSSFPEIETLAEGEDYVINRVTFKGKTYFEATYYAEGWKTCDLRKVCHYVVKTIKADTMEELEAKIAE